MLGGGELEVQNARVSSDMGKISGVSEVSHAVNISTLAKLAIDVSFFAGLIDVTFVGTLVKRTFKVVFGVVDDFGGLVGSVRPAKLKRFLLESRSETMRMRLP